jgi:hypothetical protein
MLKNWFLIYILTSNRIFQQQMRGSVLYNTSDSNHENGFPFWSVVLSRLSQSNSSAVRSQFCWNFLGKLDRLGSTLYTGYNSYLFFVLRMSTCFFFFSVKFVQNYMKLFGICIYNFESILVFKVHLAFLRSIQYLCGFLSKGSCVGGLILNLAVFRGSGTWCKGHHWRHCLLESLSSLHGALR